MDPLDQIREILDEQPHDALTQIATVLGFDVTTRPDPSRWLAPEREAFETYAQAHGSDRWFPAITPKMIAERAWFAALAWQAKDRGEPENVRTGDPYDDPAFERVARDYDVWGTARSALCAVFWRAAVRAKRPSKQDREDAARFRWVISNETRSTVLDNIVAQHDGNLEKIRERIDIYMLTNKEKK